ncbi:MAG: glycerol-3-phosphate dehydrogenase C-terminal domain-containing protein [Thermoleophilaceae bacterium]
MPIRHEGAQTLADVLLRRTMIGLGPTAGIGPDRAAARVAESHLGWDEDRAEREVEDFRRYMGRYRPRGLVEA